MRGAVLTGHGGLDNVQVVDDLTMPEPGAGQVRLKMKAAALNRLDLWVREGWKGLELDMPHVICADGAGVVDAVGADVTAFASGDAVSIDPSIIPPEDPAMMTGLENQTRNLHILGETKPGVAAEYVVLPAPNCSSCPSR